MTGKKKILRPVLCLCLALVFCMSLLLPVQAAWSQELKDALREGVENDQQIDLVDFHITQDQMHVLFEQLQDTGELPWYSYSYRYVEDPDTGELRYIIPTNRDPLIFDRDKYPQRIRQILDTVVKDGMSGWQVALAVHDYLALQIAYDEALTIFSGYEGLIGGSTVCQGYAEAYRDLMQAAGFECILVASQEMGDSGHAWNLLKLGNSWYHVDVTWDDPIHNLEGRSLHKYFLVTDEEMLSEGEDGHFGWITDIKCTDTSFQNAFWKELGDPIWLESKDRSYYRVMKDWEYFIYARDESTGEQTQLYKEEKSYADIGQGSYGYYHQGLTLFGGRLYFCTMDKVYSMLTDGTDIKEEYSYDINANRKYIRSCFVDEGGILRLTFSDHDNNWETAEYQLQVPQTHTHSYVATVTDPTCTEKGFTHYACICGDSYDDDFLDPLGHDYQEHFRVEATTDKEGYVQYKCTRCGEMREEPIPKLDSTASTTPSHQHDYKVSHVAPTCTEDGYTLYKCDCGAQYREDPVKALGHKMELVSSQNATDTRDGFAKYRCVRCGEMETKFFPATSAQSGDSVMAAVAMILGFIILTSVCAGILVSGYRRSLR